MHFKATCILAYRPFFLGGDFLSPEYFCETDSDHFFCPRSKSVQNFLISLITPHLSVPEKLHANVK